MLRYTGISSNICYLCMLHILHPKSNGFASLQIQAVLRLLLATGMILQTITLPDSCTDFQNTSLSSLQYCFCRTICEPPAHVNALDEAYNDKENDEHGAHWR